MSQEEMLQRILAILRDNFKSIKDKQLRDYCCAEKIIKTVLEPELREREKALMHLHTARRAQYDS